MSKSFSEHERDLIRQNLIEACKECWNRYGYHKTGIRELAVMANISSGAFYQFFDSKEMLFLATANEYQKELTRLFHEKMQNHPGKQGVAEGVKAMASIMADMPWITSMWEDWPVIARKLPPGYIEQDFRGDMVRIEEIIRLYKLTPKRSAETVTQIIDILLTSVSRPNFMPGETKESVDFIIDAVINDLFESPGVPSPQNAAEA